MSQYYPKNGRVILHVDMNSFYASVEMSYDSNLRGKPVAIAGNTEERRGIIITCSYEARKLGIKTTMPLWEAKKLCPSLIVLKPNFERYRKASEAMFHLLRQYSTLVEPVSIDEGYVDITQSSHLGSPLDIAKSIQFRLKDTMDLPCSIGIAPNKFLAKTASDMKKPMGITILRKRDVSSKIWPLPCVEMHGVGKKTAEKLATIGIITIGDLAKAQDIQLKALLGINGIRLKERANGVDQREVDPESIYDYKSIGNSTTLPKDTTNQKELEQVIKQLSEKVAYRLAKKSLVGLKLGVTIRYKDWKTITRSTTLLNPIFKANDIHMKGIEIFRKNWNGDPIRLLGVTALEVEEKSAAIKQLDLFSFQEDAKEEPLISALEKLQSKYGKGIISKGAIAPKGNNGTFMGAETSFSKDFFDKGQ
ncbi:DNA polymerase IV [Peribacillus alkalitolerans]|uniref:DNA polymerase IV n=1 Tax=Peribacillus alkalitolerans TaxID=1550385 RepID=UPI0013CF9D1E|nr:DNA polymerase IV [Peribacillus alkalitolerans]